MSLIVVFVISILVTTPSMTGEFLLNESNFINEEKTIMNMEEKIRKSNPNVVKKFPKIILNFIPEGITRLCM